MGELISKKFTEPLVSVCSVNPAKVIEAVGEPQLRAVLPHECLNGVQPISEYSTRKERRVKALFKEKGEDLFREFPLACCAVPIDEALIETDIQFGVPYCIALFDGHHRARFAPVFGIKRYNSMIFSVRQTSMAMELRDPHKCYKQLIAGMIDSLQSFSSKIPHLTVPPNVSFEASNAGPRTILLKY